MNANTRPAMRLTHFLWQHRLLAFGGVAAAVASSLIATGIPVIRRSAIDMIALHAPLWQIQGVVVSLLVMALLGGAVKFGMRQLVSSACLGSSYDLRLQVFATALMARPSTDRPSASLSHACVNDVERIRVMYQQLLLDGTSTALLVVTAIAWMVWIDWYLAAALLVPLAAVAMSLGRTGRGRDLYGMVTRVQDSEREMTRLISSALERVRVIRVTGRSESEVRRFQSASAALVAAMTELTLTQARTRAIVNASLGLAGVVLLGFGSRGIASDRITLGDLVALNTYLMMLARPMSGFG